MSIALLVLDRGAGSGGVEFPEELREGQRAARPVYGDINPIMRHASAIADNVNYITTSVRTDVQQVKRRSRRRTSGCSRRWS